MSLRESKVMLQGVEIYLWKVRKKKLGEGGGWRGPQRIAPFHSTVPVAPSRAGTNWCEIKFPVGYNDPGRSHTHPWISRIGKGPVSEQRAESDYLVLDCLAASLARWDKNIMLRKTLRKMWCRSARMWIIVELSRVCCTCSFCAAACIDETLHHSRKPGSWSSVLNISA